MTGRSEGVSNTRLLFILAGLWLPLWLPYLPAWLAGIAIGVALVAGYFPKIRHWSSLLLALAWSVFILESHWQAFSIDDYNQVVDVEVAINGFARQTGDVTQAPITVVSPQRLAGLRLQAKWYRLETAPLPGEYWLLQAKLKPPAGVINRFGFDYAQWLLANDFHGTASVRSGHRIAATTALSLSGLRIQLASWIDQQLPGSAAALARALMLGDRTRLDEAQRDSLIATGTAHLLAISGMHIGLVAWLGYGLARGLIVIPMVLRLCIDQRLPVHLLSLLAGLLCAACYACLAGLVVSTQRAVLMLCLIILIVLSRRQQLAGRTLLSALVLLTAIDPKLPLGAGYWLSFGAIFWLWYVFGLRTSSSARGWQSKVVLLLRTQVVLMLGMLPMQLFWFQQFSVSMVLTNLAAIPLVSLCILPLLLLALILQFFSLPLANMMLDLAGWLLVKLQMGLVSVSHMTSLVFNNLPITLPEALLGAAGALWLLAPRGLPLRWLGLVLLLPLFINGDASTIPYGQWQALVFDTGQGQAVAVRTQSHYLIYDTGPGNGQGHDMARTQLLPWLLREYHVPDKVIVSHGDLDHAGGISSIQQQWPDIRIESSVSGLGQQCAQGQQWHWDGVHFEILHPGEYLPYLGNNSSCVLRIHSSNGSLLLPGDIELPVEQRLLQQAINLRADVVLAPHHGSLSSNSTSFIEAVSPSAVIVTAGLWNRFDLPKSEVISRYADRDINVLNTARCGALLIDSHGQSQVPSITIMVQRWWQRRVRASGCAVD